MQQIALYLASGSPRRREILQQIGINFAVIKPSVVEQCGVGELPAAYVQRLAQDKARAGWAQLPLDGPRAPVLGADTIGIVDGQLLEKPRDQAHGAQLLRLMSGREHRVLTAVAITDGQTEQVITSETRVCFRPLSEEEITAYWHTGEPQDKAGGYAIQGLGAVFVREIHGSYSNVVGLPIEATVALLAAYNVPWWQTLS
ncbi:MAG TPA: nucleoside triphosphate pyrophosphatase [Cellvibrionaceae bacterium]